LDGVPLLLELGRGLYWLSPRDIHRVEILKDADATALYGMRGANGVVKITTRGGARRPE
jgi:TonB-dependent SusC/RagA subfamily outer membrane receptor